MKTFRFEYHTLFNGRYDTIDIKSKTIAEAKEIFASYRMRVFLLNIKEIA